MQVDARQEELGGKKNIPAYRSGGDGHMMVAGRKFVIGRRKDSGHLRQW